MRMVWDGVGHANMVNMHLSRKLLCMAQMCLRAHRFDWVMSLEVAEHLPRPLEPVFLFNVNRHVRCDVECIMHSDVTSLHADILH